MPHVPAVKVPTPEYLASQRRRWLERRLRVAHRLLAVAIMPAARTTAAARVARLTAELAAFDREHPRLVP